MSTKQLFPQLELGPRLGGVKELLTRLSFYNGIGNSLMVAALYYGENPGIPFTDIHLHALAPTILAFYLGLAGIAGVIAVFEHVFVVRAQAEYNQLNQFDENVSPIRRDIQRVHDRLDDLERQQDTDSDTGSETDTDRDRDESRTE